jgi:hypothetical protein
MAKDPRLEFAQAGRIFGSLLGDFCRHPPHGFLRARLLCRRTRPADRRRLVACRLESALRRRRDRCGYAAKRGAALRSVLRRLGHDDQALTRPGCPSRSSSGSCLPRDIPCPQSSHDSAPLPPRRNRRGSGVGNPPQDIRLGFTYGQSLTATANPFAPPLSRRPRTISGMSTRVTFMSLRMCQKHCAWNSRKARPGSIRHAHLTGSAASSGSEPADRH